jgi:hypothetical protein
MKVLNDFITLHLDLINLKINKKKSKSCLNKNCKKEACFNYRYYDEIIIRKHIYCKLHKLDNMINIKHKMCIKCNNKIPNYNYKNETKALYCKECSLPNMIDIKSKKCIFESCNTRPSYNYENKKEILYCKSHKLDNMVNIKDKKCIICNNKIPTYNYKNESKPLYCGDCKEINMINIKTKKCIICNNKIAIYNYKNEKKILYCGDCKDIDMIDIQSKRCKNNLCDTFVTNKYKGYCLRCFIYIFPDSKFIRDYGTREAKISEFIKETYKDLNITYNKTVKGGCSNHRPDIFIDCLTHSVIIEVDEHQHKAKSYTPECEIRRINNLFTDLADRPIIFMRFNPDSYITKNNKLKKSCFEYTEDRELPKVNKTLQIRLKKLKEEIQKNIDNIPNEHIKIIKLYYDGF